MHHVFGDHAVESGFISSWFEIHWAILHSCGDISVLLYLWKCSWVLSAVQSSKTRLNTCLIGNKGLLRRQCRVSGLISRRGGSVKVFLEFRWEPGYILELQQGWTVKTRVCSVTLGLLSSYEGHLRNLLKAWQGYTDAFRGEAGDPVYLSSFHSYIGIPINFQEESGIITVWSIELRMSLEVSKGCEASCPDEAGT